jgi:hypothetical protein
MSTLPLKSQLGMLIIRPESEPLDTLEDGALMNMMKGEEELTTRKMSDRIAIGRAIVGLS